VDRERSVWGQVEHPNIIPLYGYTEESDLFGPFGALISPVILLALAVMPAISLLIHYLSGIPMAMQPNFFKPTALHYPLIEDSIWWVYVDLERSLCY
jgi:hypothetical protein